MKWYLQALKKYAVFDGRAHRTEFWMFMLLNLIIAFALGFVLGATGMGAVLGYIYSLAVLLPTLAVGARRLHDIGRSGWWQLIAFIPVIGIIVLIYFWALDSQPGANKYGANPKGAAA